MESSAGRCVVNPNLVLRLGLEVTGVMTLMQLTGGGAEALDGLKTVVTWTLTPTKDGVLVRLEQSGFRPTEERNYQGAHYGWRRHLDGLYRVAEALVS